MEKLTESYRHTVARYMEQPRNERTLDDEAVDCLRVIQRDYAILSADKAKNTYVIHCKPWLSKQVLQETETTDTYKQALCDDGAPMELQEIIDADWEFVEAEGLAKKPPDPPDPTVPKIPEALLFHQKLPTFGVVVKTVKDNKLRFLARSHKTSLSQLSQWISKSLKIMMPKSEEMWRRLFCAAGVVATSSWVITNTKQARNRMDRMQATGKKPSGKQQTYDFTTMYTKLKLFAEDRAAEDRDDQEADDEDEQNAHESRDVLFAKMQAYVDLVFEEVKQTVKPYGVEKAMEVQHWGRSQQPWKRADGNLEDTDKVKFVTRERLMKWIEYLLKHLYVQVGDKIMRQDVGVPMGTSCSPFLANLMLFMFEFEWFAHQISSLRP